MNEAPFEIISAPGTIWDAAVGTAFPDVDVAPSVSWRKIGTTGDLNLTDAGITIAHPRTFNPFRPLGSTAPTKTFASEEDLLIRAVLADLTLEQYQHVMNENTVTESDGLAKIGLYRGVSVARRALLVRFAVSPYRDDGVSQYECPIAVQQGKPEVIFTRGGAPAALALEWHAQTDPSAAVAERLGRFVAKLADT